MPALSRLRRGFAILWALAVIAVVAVLFAIITPITIQERNATRMANTAAALRGLGVGANAMYTGLGKFPGKISQLTTVIVAGNAAYKNTCQQTFSGGDVTNWTTKGPFATFFIPIGGLWTDMGLVRDSIPDRTARTNDSLWLEMPGVSSEDAQLLDLMIDGTVNALKDTVRYHAPSGGTTTVRIRVTPISLGKC